MLRFQHTAMATQFEVHCTHADAAYARQAARAAFEAVDRLELQLSRFVENSDISRINHLAPGESTIVGYETMQCLQLARAMFELTVGAFDISMGTGFESLELVPGEFRVIAVPAPPGDQPDMPQAAEGQAGDERLTGVRLDLGAIGKGYAVDRVAEVLEDWEVPRALIDAGYSSVLALQPPEGSEGWPLTLSALDKEGTGVFARLSARQLVLGASGIRKGDHIWNPRDQMPVRARQGAWVSAPREALAAICRGAGVDPSPTAVADALSTAFMISGVEEIGEFCQNHPGVEAWILDDELTRFPR